MRATRVVLEAPLIKHGAGAAHPAVFGDELLAYLNQLVSMFNAHVHPGELGGACCRSRPRRRCRRSRRPRRA